MEEIIAEVSAYIETWVQANVEQSPTAIKSWGFAELANRESRGAKSESTQPIPMTINGTGDREQIAIEDDYDFISWIRLDVPVRRVRAEEDSWGLREGRRYTMSLRIVIAHKVELGEDLVYELADNLPENLVLTGFNFVFLDSEGSVDADHETIYNTELGKTVYEQHRFDWNVYVINLSVDYLPCLRTLSPIIPASIV